MDPQAALSRFMAALSRRDYSTANDAHEALSGWLARGGFEPAWGRRGRARFKAYRARVQFPSVKDVAHDLRLINAEEAFPGDEGGCYIDVRLQVTPDGEWYLHSGAASYDTDHRGFWGAASVPGNGRRFGSAVVARDLIAQCRDDHAQRE